MSDATIHVLLHTLGLDGNHRDAYRNHFVAGPGHHDEPHLAELVAAGLLELAPTPGFLDAGDVVYRATERGRSVAVAANNRLNPPPGRAKARYLAWLRLSDVAPDLTFGTFLRRRLYDEAVYARCYGGAALP